jgi:tRNA U34 5-carboxymethylaminomethyl modifying enzyme MnmG/GidA
MDRDLYKLNKQSILVHNQYPNLDVIEESVEDLLLDKQSGIEAVAPMAASSDDAASSSKSSERAAASSSSSQALQEGRQARIRGAVVKLNNGEMVAIEARTVNITTGTFLRQGCPHVGTRSVCGWAALARFRGGGTAFRWPCPNPSTLSISSLTSQEGDACTSRWMGQ